MGETCFGLRRRPFPATPDPSCYYPATGHERALARLQQGLADGEGALLLTAPPGLGKTLLGHCLLDRAGAAGSVWLTNSHFPDRAALLQAVLFDLSLPYEGRSEQEMRLALADHLLKAYAQGKRTLLVVDEAHHLSADLLEELRLLGNLEGRAARAVQVLLVGQPPLRDALARPELAALRQRLAVRASLEPLDLQESADYLLHHLRAAGGRPERILQDEALELLARNCGGVPRLLNQAAHQALALAAGAGAGEVDAEAVLEALSLLGLPGEGADAGREGPEGVMVIGAGDGEEAPDGPAEGPGPDGDGSCRLFAPGKPA
jgi:type II secretory pathway predicted ATPase ExeA